MANNSKHNENKDPIEEFFRNKSEEYDISYRESDWKSLEKRLDAVDEQYYARRRRNIAAAIILLVFSAMAYVIYQNYTQINRLDKELTQAEQTLDSNQNQDRTSSEEIESPDVTDNRNNAINDTPPPRQNENRDLQNAQDQRAQTPPGNGFAVADTSFDRINSAGIDCEDCRFNDLNRNDKLYSSVEILAIIHENQNQSKTPPAARNNQQFTSQVDQSSSSARASISIVAGPDLSSAGSLPGINQAGTKLGVTFNYQISEKFGVSLGAIHSDVRYTAGRGEYNPPSGYWNYGIQASKTFAQCIIIDIPLSLSYRLVDFEHSRLSASATAASYVMVSEDYQFSYDKGGYNLPERWNQKTGTTHLFSNVGLSVGYEYDLARNISVKAEPFVRIPVREVGWGNVKLYSMGTLFSLIYKLH